MIEWPPDQPEGAAFRCPHCRALVPERAKVGMVTAGRWRATRPDVRGHAGFRINALVSLLANASWAKLAAEFIAAKDDPAELQVFGNTGLAQGWADRGLGFDRCDRWVSVGPMVAMARVPTTRNHQVYAARRG